jgi:hypothetical protein
MDFRLFGAVIRRYKRIVIGGTVLAVLLSMLSYGTPGLKGGKPTVTPRGYEIWQGEAELLISQQGFPYGRAVDQYTPGSTTKPSVPIGDENYMANLSSVYAAVANGTTVQHQVAKDAGIPLCPSTRACGTVQAAEVDDISDGVPLPLITVTSSAPTAAAAAKLAGTAASVVETKIIQQQVSAGTPLDQRVQLQTLKNGSPATLEKGHSKSIPILVLFAVVAASIALAFILNNHSEDPVRPTRRRLDDEIAPGPRGGGWMAEPDHGWVGSGAGRKHLLGHRKAGSGTRLANEENAVGAGESSANGRRQLLVDRPQSHLLPSSGFEPESRD